MTSGAVFPKPREALTSVPNLILSLLAFPPHPSSKPPSLASDLEHKHLYLTIGKRSPSAHRAGDQRAVLSLWKEQVSWAGVALKDAATVLSARHAAGLLRTPLHH